MQHVGQLLLGRLGAAGQTNVKTIAIGIGIAVLVAVGFLTLTYALVNTGSHNGPLKIERR